MWRTNFVSLAVLFIAFLDPSIAQNESPAASTAAPAGGAGGAGDAGGEPALDENLERTLVSFKLFEPLSLNCTNSAAPGSVGRYDWFRNGTLVTAASAPKGLTLEEGGFVLSLRRAHEDDWGNYTCRVDGVVGAAYAAEALTLPRVPPNTNVVEGQKFSITCKLVGKPAKPVSWWFHADAAANGTQLAPGGRVALRASPAGVAGAVLEVGEAARADAGEYRCRAGGPGAPREAASVLRVKDVYAALWPFLGICLEVFVLCAIILVYEKRRTKPELDDSDADTHDQ